MKYIFIALSLLQMSFNLTAQADKDFFINKKFYLGITSGPNVSRQSSRNYPTSTPKAGFGAGLSILYPISQKLFLTNSVLFTKERNSTKFQLFASTSPDSYQLNVMAYSWAEMPLTLNYSFVNKGKFKIFFGTGISVAKLLTAEQKTTVFIGASKSIASYPFNNSFHSWNFFPRLQTVMAIKLSDHDILSMTIFCQTNARKLEKPMLMDPNSILDYNVTDGQRQLTVVGFDLQFATLLSKRD